MHASTVRFASVYQCLDAFKEITFTLLTITMLHLLFNFIL